MSAGIDPGRLNRRLALDAPTQSADGAGGVVRGFEEIAILWASVEPVSARAAVIADMSGAAVTHRIVLRWRNGITTRHRLREGARTYRIVTLRARDRRFIEIGAEELIG